MKSAAQAVRPKSAPAPEVRRSRARPPAMLSASPRYLRASVRLGGLNDPEEREAEHAAGVIAAGGCYQVRDPGGSMHLRPEGETAPERDTGTARPAVAASVVDPGASGRVRRAAAPAAAEPGRLRAAVQSPVIDPGASGRVRRLAARAPVDPGGTVSLRAMHVREMHATSESGKSDTVRRAPPGLPFVAPGAADAGAAQRIERARAAAAPPLSPGVRARLEKGLGEKLEAVRVHAGPTARAAAAGIGARAYTEGERITLGHGESEHDLGLMAHEATHVVQNRRAAGIARGVPPAAGAIRGEASATAKDEVRPAEGAAPVAAGPIRRGIVSRALDFLADKANLIPGFRLFTIILGVNPVNMAPVDRSGANILRAAVEIIPIVGPIVKALDSYGVFDKAGAWVDQQIATLKMTGAAIRDALMEFIDSLHLSDIFHPGDVWDRAKRIFTEPIDRIKAFFEALAEGLIALIKYAILRPLAALAAKTRAWDLLIVVLKKNPITSDAVPRTPETLIGGFMKLIRQEQVWTRIKQANALGRAWAWFQKALAGLLAFVEQIPALFISTLKSFQVSDLLDLPGAFARVAAAFGNFVARFISWAGHTVLDLLEIVFDVVSPGAFAYIKKTGAALASILKNPLPFVRNLVKAAKLGFQNFADNIGTHLKAGLIDWLTGSLPGVYIPKALSLAEFGKFALSVLGITWAQIRAKIVKALGPNGETIMKGLETGFAIVVALVSGGAAAAWELIKEKLTDLKDVVIDAITGVVVDTIVKQAIPKLVSMFIPGAGFISAIISIYDTIMVFVAKLAKIAAVVMAFVDSIAAIAAGQIAGAAARVEAALAGLLSLAISFLAGFFGLGNIAEKLMGAVGKVRAAVDKALDTAIGCLIGKAKALGKFAVGTAGALIDWWKEKLGFTNKDGEGHTLQFIGTGDSAQLGIATSLAPVRDYLDSHPDKGTTDWNTANSVFNGAMQVIYSPAAKSQAEQDRRARIKQELAKVSAAFSRLSGAPPDTDDYGENTEPRYGNPAEVKVIVGKPLAGTPTGAWPKTEPGYKEIYNAGLTKATDPWVQMHIISEKLGGDGSDLKNLVPAPQSVNTGPFRSFEHATAALPQAKSGTIKNRVWVKVTVSGTKTAPSAISGSSGLYFWKGKKASPKWLKSEQPSFTANAGIPTPQLKGPRKLVLNFTSGTEMRRDFGISGVTASLVKEGRPYASQADFVTSMTKRGATMAQVNAVLGRGAVLDGP